MIGALAALWYAVVNALSENFLFDTLSALSLMIAFYYALSGIACVVYYRHELLRSVRNLLFIGVAPLLGALILGYLLVTLGDRPRPTPRRRTRAARCSASACRCSSARRSSRSARS